MMNPPFSTETLFVVGNGPSLKSFDFENLKGRHWLGMNAAYRHWSKLGHYPTYYACLDRVVGLSHLEAIRDLALNADQFGIQSLLLDDHVADAIGLQSPKIIKAMSIFGHEPNLVGRITTGSHSVLWGVQLGYQQIALLGIDQNYQEEVDGLVPRKGSRLDVATATDSPNYYFPDYQQVGDALNRPNPVPHVHASAWRRVMRTIVTDFPQTTVHNISPHSTLPATQTSRLSKDMTIIPSSSPKPQNPVSQAGLVDISLSQDMQLSEAINRLIPKRFSEVTYSEPTATLRMFDLGFGWRSVEPTRASHAGRWHLHVGQFRSDPIIPKFGSVVFLPLTQDRSPADPLWVPNGIEFFDNIVRLMDPAGDICAILALRLDHIAPSLHGTTLNPSPLQRIKYALHRSFWGCVRRFDAVRATLARRKSATH